MCGHKRKRRTVLNGNDDIHINLSLSLSLSLSRERTKSQNKMVLLDEQWPSDAHTHIATSIHTSHCKVGRGWLILNNNAAERERERESGKRRWRFPLLQSIYWSLAWPLQSSISTKRRKVTCTLPLGNTDREKWRGHCRRKQWCSSYERNALG